MAEFAYNNAKNTSTRHTLVELNCGYYSCIFNKEDINPCSYSKSAEELVNKLKDLMTIYRKNLYHTQKLQKQYYNKTIKPKSYAPSDKVWLNSKYIKTKNQNYKLEAKFFRPFWVLHPMGKQAYKIELPKK